MKYIADNFNIDSIAFLQTTRLRFPEFKLDCFWNFLNFRLTWVPSESDQQNQVKIKFS